ncbi:universal stress protein, partial [Eudoraea sp.]
MNILLPIDFSKNSRNAIAYAMELFKNEKCKFFFLHTYTPSFYRMDYM